MLRIDSWLILNKYSVFESRGVGLSMGLYLTPRSANAWLLAQDVMSLSYLKFLIAD